MEDSNCPICNNQFTRMIRYPNTICNECSKHTIDKNGNTVVFANIDEFGGFQSRHFNNNNNNAETKSDHTCYVNGIECYADEARFGGIVIQTVNGLVG
jgi:hypothetical protein